MTGGHPGSVPLTFMADTAAATMKAVLLALADLAPSAEPTARGLAVPTEWFRWLPISALRLFLPHNDLLEGRFQGPAFRLPLDASGSDIMAVAIERHFGERLAAVDQLRPGQRSLRVGWLFVAGRTTAPDGRTRRVFHPLVTTPVRVSRGLGAARLVPAGDTEITELVTDAPLRHQLEDAIEYGGGALVGEAPEVAPALLARLDRLRHFSASVAAAAGIPASQLVPATDGPDAFMRREGLAIVAGVGVFAIHEVGESSRASSLRAWSEGDLDRPTALHSLYLDLVPAPVGPDPTPGAVESPYLLTPVQRQAVAASRVRPVTLLSGAPGTGKSHSIAAIVCDALAHGERVLVAAKSDATVDALLDLLERAPGPDPVVFGSNERRQALANRLSAGQLQPVAPDTVTQARATFDACVRRRDELGAMVADRLAAELLLDGASESTEVRSTVPGLFEPGTDLDLVQSLLAAAASPDGWLAHRKAHKALDRAREACAAPETVPADALRAARGRPGGPGRGGPPGRGGSGTGPGVGSAANGRGRGPRGHAGNGWPRPAAPRTGSTRPPWPRSRHWRRRCAADGRLAGPS